MNRGRRLCQVVLLVSAAFVTAMPAMADHHQHASNSHKAGSPVIESAWSRATPGQAPNGVVFMKILNHGSHADRLVSASSSVAEAVEIHTHVNDDGIMRMRRIPGLELPPGQAVELKPGGYHLMLIGLHKPLKKDQSFTVKLDFGMADSQVVTVKVMGIGAMGGRQSHNDQQHRH